jgi:DNA-binding transcriptional regulator YiaG
MPTLVVALKDEIRRLARKEIRAQTATTVRAVAQYRREIARLKRELRELDRKLKQVAARRPSAAARSEAGADQNGGARFSARSVRAQRKRTNLSAAEYARLVGVSPLTIYNWEHNKTRPRHEQLAALVALRGIGKREAQARLAAANGAPAKPRSKRRRPRTKK